MTNLANDTVSWSEGTILFGGSELYQVNSGSTQDGAPYGVGGDLVDATRYIIFWDKDTPNNFQTIIETSYIEAETRVIVFEITGAPVGASAQIIARDATYGASDKLNSDSFNKIVGGTFSTGALTGTGTPPASGVLFNNTGFYMYDGTSSSEAVHLKTDGLRFYNGSGNVTAKYDGSAVTYYNASASTVDATDVMAVFNASSLTFYNNSGEGASNKTVSLVGNNSTAANNGLYIYGVSASSFGVNDQSLVTFESTGGVVYAHMGMLVDAGTATSANYLTLAGKGNTGVYLYANDSPGSAGGLIILAPNVSAGIQQVGVTNAGTAVGQTFKMPHYTHVTPGVDPINQAWVWPSAAPNAGQYLEAGAVDSGGYSTNLKWSTPTFTAHNLHSTALASGSVPVPEYGTFRYTTDGGGGTADTLAFASGQTNATPASATAQSSFWSMLSESDGVTGSRLIFEPIVDYGGTGSNTDMNRAYIGWHNPLFAIYGYYLNAGDGSASFPSHSFWGDFNTGMFRNSEDNLGFSTGGTARIQLYSGGLYPSSDNFYDLGHSSYRWDDVYATNGTIQTSDVRLKELITPITLGLDFVNDLNPVSYKWKNKKEDKVDQTHYGILAQEVMETLEKYGISSVEEFGGITYEGGEEDYYGARYTEFIPMLIKAVQELSDEVKELKEKN